MKLIFASHNAHKAREIAALLDDLVSIVSLEDIGLYEDIAETGVTLFENAEIKAVTVADLTGLNCFADDSGLCVDALDGAPGVYSARYAGQQKNHEDNMQKLLRELAPHTNRSARFTTVICLAWKGNRHFFEGNLHGSILKEKRGSGGFGYDPLFMPDGFNKTLAEMTLEEKNRISHRARAFKAMRTFLAEHISS